MLQLEKTLVIEYSSSTLQQVCKLKSQSYEFYNSRVGMALFLTRSNYYEIGDKIGRLWYRFFIEIIKYFIDILCVNNKFILTI